MRVFRGFGAVPEGMMPTAVAIGNFDGVHLGHRAVLTGLVDSATRRNLVPVAVTFLPHPLRILAPERAPSPLQTLEDRLENLAALGLKAVVVVPFHRLFASLGAREFLDSLLKGRLHVREVRVGSDARFGRGREGDVEMLRNWGAGAGVDIVVAEDIRVGDRRVSSSGLRRLVAQGKVDEAMGFLGRPFEISGEVVRGASRGRRIGFPTANLIPDLSLVPLDGIYAAVAKVEGRGVWPAAVHVGPVPTFGGRERVVEAHLLGFQGELLGSTLRLGFLRRIRSIEKFDDVNSLRQRIEEDVRITEEVVRSWHLDGLDKTRENG